MIRGVSQRRYFGVLFFLIIQIFFIFIVGKFSIVVLIHLLEFFLNIISKYRQMDIINIFFAHGLLFMVVFIKKKKLFTITSII